MRYLEGMASVPAGRDAAAEAERWAPLGACHATEAPHQDAGSTWSELVERAKCGRGSITTRHLLSPGDTHVRRCRLPTTALLPTCEFVLMAMYSTLLMPQPQCSASSARP